MKQFVCKRTRLGHDLKAVESFDSTDDLGAAVCKELAEIEGLEAEIFVGCDLVDVVGSHEGFFAGRRAA